ncbi:hypothetical protein OHB26_20730 [Nocardia sp. NBC_01503]|uniref:hypothetical protein n=1 Tax=Nocardia sp. NBC_01503 TaxID=2975997 RepID=UPI002E7C2147|nr:hypothetical protein [Nocardia sp. NBC_01503]WTL29428.1 hypothetical protein OHB26_20730 [Nocardia sp. NBC_01503]
MTSVRSRQGSIWCAEDYRLLVDALRRNLPDEEVAAYVGRTVSGVRSRAKFLLLNAYRESQALGRLRVLVSEVDYDWESLVREAHGVAGTPYWDDAADQRLTAGWTAVPAPTMAELTAALGVSEQDIARRCIRLDLTNSRADVVDHFGAAPGGELAAQARLARDKASMEIGVLVVTSSSGEVAHLSLHPSADAALDECRMLPSHKLSAPPTAWTVNTRVVGNGNSGTTRTGPWGEWPQEE